MDAVYTTAKADPTIDELDMELNFLDRSNIGNARLAGLEASLKMPKTSLDYNVALAIFFPFYVFAGIPSNLVMKRFRPSIWLPSIMVVWGTMCCLTGIVHNYTGLLAIRAALGLAEGGLFPGITFYITMWYKRNEVGLRVAIFFSAATAAGAFGGLLARAIMELDGKRGLRAWSWIFIIEGAVTLVVALSAFFGMHDYPKTATFLSLQERMEVVRRLEADHSFLDDMFHWQYVREAFCDWKIWVHMFITIGIFSSLYSFSLFLPTIISKMGYTDSKAQLMTAPPYVVACFFCVMAGWVADKHRQRGVYMIGFNLIAIIGFVIQLRTGQAKFKYLGTFFAAAGIYSNVPQTVAWNGNNIGGSTKRSVGLAMQVGFGNLGGILSGFTYLTKDAPMYHMGHGIVIGLLTMSTILCVVMRWYCVTENAKRDAADKIHGREGGWNMDHMRIENGKGLGDNSGSFRYTV
ncbi:major facilitator superfamily transporter [Lophiostoma macrostomum CBS 122681]|uniref:Major facilitator superfamily transporter n=1 Tax=Lophiostoma macrostomum CBS 122681 TaxID=1314788 RepID=A0A6A6TCI8_9PLEO|nr:major facilitator superfamily transporter [Lophiostoma macrostomum CBS 122681]